MGTAGNATITVAYKGREITFELQGSELSEGFEDEYYLNNASKHMIAEQVEKALKGLI